MHFTYNQRLDMRFSYDTYAGYHSRTFRKLFANKIMYSSSLIILKTSRTNDVRLCEIMWDYVKLRADYVRLCAIHIIVRAGWWV